MDATLLNLIDIFKGWNGVEADRNLNLKRHFKHRMLKAVITLFNSMSEKLTFIFDEKTKLRNNEPSKKLKESLIKLQEFIENDDGDVFHLNQINQFLCPVLKNCSAVVFELQHPVRKTKRDRFIFTFLFF